MNRVKPTPEQLAVLTFIAEGFGRDAIAERLGITYDQVRWRIETMYRRLDARDAAHAVAICARNAWLPPGPPPPPDTGDKPLREQAYGWSDEVLRAAHLSFSHYGIHTPDVIAGEREYQRRRKARNRQMQGAA